MSFESYNWVWLVWAIPFLLLLLIYVERKRSRLLTQLFQDSLQQRLPKYARLGRPLQFVFFILALFAMLLALMKPFDGVETIQIDRQGVDIYVLADVSPSMLAQDIKPSRMERVRYEILDLLKMLKGDRVGLIAFSGEAFVMVPLTGDYETFQIFLNELHPDLFPKPGTDIKGAIETAVESFQKSGSPASAKAIILMTDGEDSIGLDEKTLAAIQKLNVKVFVMGVGSLEGAPVPNHNGGYKSQSDGNLVMSKLNEESLQKLALVTGGGYVRSTALAQDLNEIYNLGIKSILENQQLAKEEKKLPNYQFQIFLILATLFFMFEVLTTHKKWFWFSLIRWKRKKST